MTTEKSNKVLAIFEWVVLLLLASTTFLFGYEYIGTVFGDSVAAGVFGAAYCLILLDVAFLVWRRMQYEQGLTKDQRNIALTLAIVSFIGSLMTSIAEFVLGTSLLNVSPEIQYAVGMVTFILLLIVLAGHAAGLYTYRHYSTQQKLKDKTADIQADAIDSALEELKALAIVDKDAIVEILSQEFRENTLHLLGFTPGLTRVGKSGSTAAIEGELAKQPTADPDQNVRRGSRGSRMGYVNVDTVNGGHDGREFHIERFIKGRWQPDLSGYVGDDYEETKDHVVEQAMSKGVRTRMLEGGEVLYEFDPTKNQGQLKPFISQTKQGVGARWVFHCDHDRLEDAVKDADMTARILEVETRVISRDGGEVLHSSKHEPARNGTSPE